MCAFAIGRTLRSPSALFRVFFGSKRRGLITLCVVVAGATAAALTLSAFSSKPWPAKAVLRTPGDTWPLAFSPDSRSFATYSRDGITLWDTNTAKPRTTWSALAARSVGIGTFSPDGKLFAAALIRLPEPTAIAVIDTDTGEVKVTLSTRRIGMYALAFVDSGRSIRALMFGSSNTKECLTWDATTGEQTDLQRLTCPAEMTGAAAVSADIRFLAIARRGGAGVTVWDIESDREVGVFVNNSPTASPASGGLGFSRDGRTLAVGRANGTLEIWDVPTRQLRRTIRGHSTDYVSHGIRLASDGQTLTSWGQYLRPTSVSSSLRLQASQTFMGRTWWPPAEVIVLDLNSGNQLRRAAKALLPCFSPDSATIATREEDLSVRLRSNPLASR
jgi:WD40 repeat protein